MFFVWGSRLYGKVDEVPGLFYVATKFGHLWYLPLIPMGSHVVFRDRADAWEGMRIPLSLKSVATAWIRAGLVLGVLGSTIGLGWNFLTASFLDAIVCGFTGALMLGLFVLTKKLKPVTRCDLRRARTIAEKAGFNEETIQLLEAHFMAREAAFPPSP